MINKYLATLLGTSISQKKKKKEKLLTWQQLQAGLGISENADLL